MIPLFSTRQIRETDSFAINNMGIPSLILMENAALKIFNISINKLNSIQKTVEQVGFVCGKGNNGGDGFAAARHFSNHGFRTTVIYLADEEELSEDALTNFRILTRTAEENKNILLRRFSSVKDLKYLKECDVIFDAMLGSGTEGELREPYRKIVDELNFMDAYKIAIDIPTGLNADSGFSSKMFYADLTITLAEFKKGLFIEAGYAGAGEIIKGNIGVSSLLFDRYEVEDYLIEPEDVFHFLPQKKKDIHKYSAGKVFSIAGSAKLPGAASLTSSAVLKAGAGSSILAFPESSRKLIKKASTEIIIEAYNDNQAGFLSSESVGNLSKRIKWADVLAIGPGLGREEETISAVQKIIREHQYKNIVIDADAVIALGDNEYKNLDISNAVLTPHQGEFSNLIGIETDELKRNLLKYGKDFSTSTGSYLVLKGAPTIIFNPDGEAFINTSGNPGMAKFGTGDVLTGILAAFIAQIKNIEEAIISGVYLHSLAADLLLKDYTEYSYTASDIMKKLPSAIKFLRNSFDQ